MHTWRDQVKLVLNRLCPFMCVRDLKLVDFTHFEHLDKLKELVELEIRFELDDMDKWPG